jgi:hypothetical protein
MSDQIKVSPVPLRCVKILANVPQELAEIPRAFLKEGTAFMQRCTKRTCASSFSEGHENLELTYHNSRQA